MKVFLGFHIISSVVRFIIIIERAAKAERANNYIDFFLKPDGDSS